MYIYKIQWPLLIICKQIEKSEWERISIYCLREWERIDTNYLIITQEKKEINEKNIKNRIYKTIKYKLKKTFFNENYKNIYNKKILIPIIIKEIKYQKHIIDLEIFYKNIKEEFYNSFNYFNDTLIKFHNKEILTIIIYKKKNKISPFESLIISKYILNLEIFLNKSIKLQNCKITKKEILKNIKIFLNSEFIDLNFKKIIKNNILKNKFQNSKEIEKINKKIKIMTTKTFNIEFYKQKNNLKEISKFDFLNSNYCTIVTTSINNYKLSSNFEEVAIRSKRLLLRNSPIQITSMFNKIDMLISNFKNYINFNYKNTNKIVIIKPNTPKDDCNYIKLLKLLFSNYKNFCFFGSSVINDDFFNLFRFNIYEIYYNLIYLLL